MLGCPQLVVPSESALFLLLLKLKELVGQNAYDSEVSGLVEYAPIVTTLAGPSRKSKSNNRWPITDGSARLGQAACQYSFRHPT